MAFAAKNAASYDEQPARARGDDTLIGSGSRRPSRRSARSAAALSTRSRFAPVRLSGASESRRRQPVELPRGRPRAASLSAVST